MMIEPKLRPMTASDLDAIMAIERVNFPFPWTEGNFKDSMSSGYICLVMEQGNQVMGYAVLIMVLDEAHLLNISVAALHQHQGLGRQPNRTVWTFYWALADGAPAERALFAVERHAGDAFGRPVGVAAEQRVIVRCAQEAHDAQLLHQLVPKLLRAGLIQLAFLQIAFDVDVEEARDAADRHGGSCCMNSAMRRA